MKQVFCFVALLLAAANAYAQLTVGVSPVKLAGQKAIVPLALKNNFGEKIESARAAVLLLDEQGKMVGQGAKWVIDGNQRTAGLAAGATNVFHFVITSETPFASTNLMPKITFTRVVLEGGKLADPTKDVVIQK